MRLEVFVEAIRESRHGLTSRNAGSFYENDTDDDNPYDYSVIGYKCHVCWIRSSGRSTKTCTQERRPRSERYQQCVK